MPEVMTLETAANQLADVIKNAPEWKNFHEINGAFEADAEISGLMGEYREIVGRLQASQNHDRQSPEIRRLEELQIKIQQNPLFQRRENAADQMLAVLGQANAALTVSLGIDFATNAKSQQGGCCGGGGGEGGGCGCS